MIPADKVTDTEKLCNCYGAMISTCNWVNYYLEHMDAVNPQYTIERIKSSMTVLDSVLESYGVTLEVKE